MRPTINVLGDELIGRMLAEAQRIMAEVGMEIRGPKLRQRLIDHGLKTTADKPDLLSTGIAGVWVAGEQVYEGGGVTDALPAG